MHMADALLSPAAGGVMYAASAAAIVYSVKKIKKDELGDSKIPLMAVTGAMVFAAQMINFTIPGTGSSGHITGGILLAALLGPFAGLLAMSAVLVIQCLIFADGGLLALGANIFNMGVIACLFVYPLITRRLFSKAPSQKRIWIGSIVSVVIALQLGAFAVVLQTTASGIVELPFSAFALLMQPIHLAIGVVEGIVTAAILSFVFAARPRMLEAYTDPVLSESAGGQSAKPKSAKKVIIVFAIIAAVTAAGISLLASAYPDGLEWSIEGVSGAEELEASGPIFTVFADIQERMSFMPDYDTPAGTGSGTSAAGLLGAAMVFALAFVVMIIIRAVRKPRKDAVKQDT